MYVPSFIYHAYEVMLKRSIKNGQMPRHVAIILDGNRRYARYKKISLKESYNIAMEKLHEVLRWCWELKIEIVTVWGFSIENFSREEEQVNTVMNVAHEFLRRINHDEKNNVDNIRIRVLGQKELLSQELRQEIEKIECRTKENGVYNLNVCFAYGGRTEIIDAVKKLAKNVIDGKLAIDQIDEEIFEDNLYTRGIPHPDLMIRTSGEERLSGFLLWQIAYTELFFSDVYWPAYRKIDLYRAIKGYQQRKRNYGR